MAIVDRDGIASGHCRVEPDHPAARLPGKRARIWLGRVKYRKSLGRHRFHQPRLGGDVALHGAMAVQVVRGNVQHQRDIGVKSLYGLQLKTG